MLIQCHSKLTPFQYLSGGRGRCLFFFFHGCVYSLALKHFDSDMLFSSYFFNFASMHCHNRLKMKKPGCNWGVDFWHRFKVFFFNKGVLLTDWKLQPFSWPRGRFCSIKTRQQEKEKVDFECGRNFGQKCCGIKFPDSMSQSRRLPLRLLRQ